MSSTLDKFIATTKELRLSEINTNELFLNFCILNDKYKDILKYDDDIANIYQDIIKSLSNKDIIQINRNLIITMSDEKKDEIEKLMSVDEKKSFYNLTKDYINLNVERFKKEKSL